MIKFKVRWLILPASLQITIVALLYFLNKVYGNLYDGIQQYNTSVIYQSIATFAGLAFALVITSGFGTFFNNKLAWKIREATYNSINVVNISIHYSTVPQRLQEDTKRVSDTLVELGAAILKAGIKLPLFAYVIASVTQWWVALVIISVVVVGTILTKIFAKGLVKAQSCLENEEALFRRDLGVSDDKIAIPDLLRIAFNEWNRELKKLLFLQSGLGQTFALLPFILLMPLYLSKAITLGSFFQSVNALNKVVDSLSVLIDNRTTIASFYTSYQRLKEIKK